MRRQQKNGAKFVWVASVAVWLAGCGGVQIGDVPTPKNAPAQAGLVISRYLNGGYHGTINDTLNDRIVVYQWDYTQGVSLLALLMLDDLVDDVDLAEVVRVAAERYDESNKIRPDGGDVPIDYAGSMSYAILMYSELTEDKRFRDQALEIARYFHEDAPRTPDGLIGYHSDPKRGRIWVDALFMIAPLITRAGVILEDDAYLDDVVDQLFGYSAKLRDEQIGLYHQGWNWHGEGASPGYWGRANGWMALALVEVLDALPKDYERREEVLSLFRDFMDRVEFFQGPGGMWHQLIDQQFGDSYEETSCTGMFVYAMCKGVNKAWLDDTYLETIDRAHSGLSRMISVTGNISNVCPGTSTQSSEQGYLDKRPQTNNAHGTGPVMLALYGLLAIEEEVGP